MTRHKLDRTEIFERVHAVALRIGLQPAARAQSISAAVAHAKPESSMPDLSLLRDLRDLEGELIFWLERAEWELGLDRHGSTMERFHRAIVAVDDRDINNLHTRLTDLEYRLRIEWKAGTHDAVPPVSLDELRRVKNRQMFFDGFGLGSKAATELLRKDGMNIGDHEVRELRRNHGVDGRTGARKEKCPTAIVEHLFTDGCAQCMIVDDLERDGGRGRRRPPERAAS